MTQVSLPFIFCVDRDGKRRQICIDTITVDIGHVDDDRLGEGRYVSRMGGQFDLNIALLDGVPVVNSAPVHQAVIRASWQPYVSGVNRNPQDIIQQRYIGSQPVVPFAGYDHRSFGSTMSEAVDPYGSSVEWTDYDGMRDLAFRYADAMFISDNRLFSTALQPVEVVSLETKKPGRSHVEFRDRVAGWRQPRSGGLNGNSSVNPCLAAEIRAPQVFDPDDDRAHAREYILVERHKESVICPTDLDAMRFADAVHWLANTVSTHSQRILDTPHAGHCFQIVAASSQIAAVHLPMPDTDATITAARGVIAAYRDPYNPITEMPGTGLSGFMARLAVVDEFLMPYEGPAHVDHHAISAEEEEAFSLLSP